MPATFDRLYVVVSPELSRGAQTAQALHALAELQDAYPDQHRAWTRADNIVIALEGDPKEAMRAVTSASSWPEWIPHGMFREPDFHGMLTAVAYLNPSSDIVRHAFQAYPLLGSKRRSRLTERRLRRQEDRLRGSTPDGRE